MIEYDSFFMMFTPLSVPHSWQLAGLEVLRRVIHFLSEEARTRGFQSPPFGGFGFIVLIY
jgi:hypothetical protein